MEIVSVTRLDLGECIARKKPNVNARHLLSHQEASKHLAMSTLLSFSPTKRSVKKRIAAVKQNYLILYSSDSTQVLAYLHPL